MDHRKNSRSASHDGRVRNVKVKTPSGKYSRPITKIAGYSQPKVLTNKRMKKYSPSSGQRKCYHGKTLLMIDNDRKQFD